MEIGLCVRSVDVSAKEFGEIAKHAEDLGFSSVWITEELARSAFSMLMSAALATSRIALGTAIVNVYSRTPLTIAMEACTLDEATGSRFILGLGTGGLEFIEKGHGLHTEKPTLRMIEYLNIIRAYLSGERVMYHGQFFHLGGLRTWVSPSHKIPIYVGALNPRMLKAAGQSADGLILNMFSPKALSYVKEHLGHAVLENIPPGFRMSSFVLTTRSPQGLNDLKRAIAFYCAAPTYRKMLSVLGYEHVAAEVNDLWRKGQREAALQKIPENLVDEVSIVSENDDLASKRIREYSSAGVVPLLYPQPAKDKEVDDIRAILSNVASTLQLKAQR